MFTRNPTKLKALAAQYGQVFSPKEIADEAAKWKQSAKTTPNRNMVVALQMHAHLNTREEWLRLIACATAARGRVKS